MIGASATYADEFLDWAESRNGFATCVEIQTRTEDIRAKATTESDFLNVQNGGRAVEQTFKYPIRPNPSV